MSRTALITGGAKRIGRAIALDLAGDGWDIALHYNSSDDEARQTAREVAALGRRCELLRGDLRDDAVLDSLVARAADVLDGLELLVNNASTFGAGSLAETDANLLDSQLAVNFRAPVLLSRQFAAACSRGQIINMLDSRVSGVVVDHLAYTLAKKALASFTQIAAKALGPHIRVNAACPGIILPAEGDDEGKLDRLAARVPLKRTGKIAEVTDAIRFLVKNEYVTGQILFIDGGQGLR